MVEQAELPAFDRLEGGRLAELEQRRAWARRHAAAAAVRAAEPGPVGLPAPGDLGALAAYLLACGFRPPTDGEQGMLPGV